MSKQETKFKLFRVANDFTLDNLNTDPIVGVTLHDLEGQRIEGENPAKGLVGYPLITTPGMYIYGTAQYIHELDEATPHLDSAYLALFNICASYPDLIAISFIVDIHNTLKVLLETKDKEVYCWRSVGSDKIFVAERNKPEPKEEGIVLNPSELICAFSVTAEHIRMGSNQFRIASYSETNDFVVSFYDYDKVEIRMDFSFPLMSRNESPVIH